MPKNTKDLTEKKVVSKSKKITNKSAEKPKASSKKTVAKKETAKSEKSTVAKTKKASTKTTTSKTTAKASTTKKTTSSAVKKASNTAKKATTKKASTKKTTASTAKKATNTAKKTAVKSTKKTTTKKAVTKKPTNKSNVIEYYDLPYRYNETVVKILAQTPTTLFVYWDISDEDRKNYINKFGENFFENTIPVLLVKNKTLNYSFEIEINDFANSWYFNVNDSKCDYEIELGRKAKLNKIDLPNNYIPVTSSNVIESPNNHILFEENQKILFFRNVKTNSTISKDVSNLNFMKYAGRIYNIYKEIYKNQELEDLEKLSSSRV